MATVVAMVQGITVGTGRGNLPPPLPHPSLETRNEHYRRVDIWKRYEHGGSTVLRGTTESICNAKCCGVSAEIILREPLNVVESAVVFIHMNCGLSPRRLWRPFNDHRARIGKRRSLGQSPPISCKTVRCRDWPRLVLLRARRHDPTETKAQ